MAKQKADWEEVHIYLNRAGFIELEAGGKRVLINGTEMEFGQVMSFQAFLFKLIRQLDKSEE